jgi:DNA-binding NtrC family response regulator
MSQSLDSLKTMGGTIAAMHVLLIEDDLDLGRAFQSALKVEGLTSEWFRRLLDAPQDADFLNFDCVLRMALRYSANCVTGLTSSLLKPR